MTAPMASHHAILSSILTVVFKTRKKHGFWCALNEQLISQGEKVITFATLLDWQRGAAFPRTRKTQMVLAEIVRGFLGRQIAAIPDPPFRYWRPPSDKESEMSHHSSETHREFPMVQVREPDGKAVSKAVISCSNPACGEHEFHWRRKTEESDDHFKKLGWHVGSKNADDDLCPKCVAEQAQEKKMKATRINDGRVIHMADAKKKTDPPQNSDERKMKLSDRSIITNTIDDHFDEVGNCYSSGWSDIRIAADLNVPIEWVKEVRDLACPGSVGDNPDIATILAGLEAIDQQLKRHDQDVDKLMASTSALDLRLRDIEDEQRKVRTDAARINGDRNSLREQFAALAEKTKYLDAPQGMSRRG